jgi:hypothetical protein
VHGQFALNLAPCPADCKFCSFAISTDLFKEAKELTIEEAIRYALDFEKNRECACIYVMTTANYDFGKFIEFSSEIRRYLNQDTIMIANIGDQNLKKCNKTERSRVYRCIPCC